MLFGHLESVILPSPFKFSSTDYLSCESCQRHWYTGTFWLILSKQGSCPLLTGRSCRDNRNAVFWSFFSMSIPSMRLSVALLEHFNWENQHYQFYAVPVGFQRNFPAQRKFLFKIKIALNKLIIAVLKMFLLPDFFYKSYKQMKTFHTLNSDSIRMEWVPPACLTAWQEISWSNTFT